MLFLLNIRFGLLLLDNHFFIIDISLDVELCEEQDDTNRFLIWATVAKLWSYF